MELNEIIKNCRIAFDKAGLDFDHFGIEVSINGRLKTTLGRCKGKYINEVYTPFAIEFSKQLVETSTEKSILDVIYHECAHAIADIETGERNGHNATFKRVCARIGTDNDGSCTKDLERTVPEDQIYKYFVVCEKCGGTNKYHRAGKVIKNIQFYNCKCGGKLKVIQNF